MRNWIIGYYIVEFEQKGNERAEYGEHLLEKLEERVAVKGLTKEVLSLCRSFYTIYPQMASLLRASSEPVTQILDSVNQELEVSENKYVAILDSVNQELQSSPESIISRLSFSHIRALIPIADPVVRFFYEQQCMRETWSVRELRRQITSNLHVRVGLSRDPEKCLALAGGEENSTQLQVRDR